MPAPKVPRLPKPPFLQGKPKPDPEPQQPQNPHLARLSNDLYLAARDSARIAVSKYAMDERSDRFEAALSVGMAAEFLMRAVLASRDPLLLAAGKSWHSMVMLSRANVSTPVDVAKLRTISFNDAVELLNAMFQTLNLSVDLRAVIEVRNAAAHAAMIDSSSLADAVLRLVNIVTKLHELLPKDPDVFWGAHLVSLVAQMQDEYSDALRRRVESKIAYARLQLDRIIGDMTDAGREATLTAFEARSVGWVVDDDHKDEDAECPACHRTGQATYVADRDEPPEVEPEYDSDGDLVGSDWTQAVYYSLHMFQCPVCGLVLEGDELGSADIPTELPTEYEVVDDPWEDYEPDEDYLRGR